MSLDLCRRGVYAVKDGILCLSFNQDHGCFTVGTDAGFRVYNCDPFRETVRRNFPDGGIGIAEMLFRTNILALVGGGKNPCWQPDRVQIWDDHTAQVVGTLHFKDSEVRGVKVHPEAVVVATPTCVYVYDADRLELQQKHRTVDNPLGLLDVAPSLPCVVLYPSWRPGVVGVEADDERSGFVHAHHTAIAGLKLSADGTLLATASGKGTRIRVFDTATQELVVDLRRGYDSQTVYSMCFSADNKLLAVSCSGGRVQVFSTEPGGPGWLSDSVAKFTAPDPSVCAFGADSKTLYVLAAEGSFHKLQEGVCVAKNHVFSRSS